MNKRVVSAVVAIAGILISGVAVAGDQPAMVGKKAAVKTKIVPQTLCPVMHLKINKDLYVDHDGKRVYVCCAMCVAKVKKSPEKYIKALESEGVTLARFQTNCPVMGGKINKKYYVDYDGKRIYVCCPGCIGKIKADPEKYIKKLEADGVVLDATPKLEKAES